MGAAFFAFGLQASAQAQPPGYPTHDCPGQISVSTTNPLPGETITVTGSGFKPGVQVHLVMHTVTYDLGTFTADAQGSFTAHVKLPAGVYGKHLIISAVDDAKKCPADPIQIQSPGGESTGPGGPPGTSFTGTDLLMILVAAGVLLGAGALFLRGGKRRSAEHV